MSVEQIARVNVAHKRMTGSKRISKGDTIVLKRGAALKSHLASKYGI